MEWILEALSKGAGRAKQQVRDVASSLLAAEAECAIRKLICLVDDLVIVDGAAEFDSVLTRLNREEVIQLIISEPTAALGPRHTRGPFIRSNIRHAIQGRRIDVEAAGARIGNKSELRGRGPARSPRILTTSGVHGMKPKLIQLGW